VVLFLLSSCGPSDQQRVNTLKDLFKQHKYRDVISTYETTRSEISDTSENRRASLIYKKATDVIRRINKLIIIADSLQKLGFIDDAKKYLEDASQIEQTDTVSTNKLKYISSLVGQKRPKYFYRGMIENYEFQYIFHTRWKNNEILPDTVEIFVKNHDNIRRTALAYFIPSLWYLKVTRNGISGLAVILKSEIVGSERFSRVIWPSETFNGKTNYSNVNIMRENTNISISRVFKTIIIGTDEAYYINLIGYKYSKIRQLNFTGFE
jgi:hypothetical protein